LLRWIAFWHRGSDQESERGVYRDALDRVEIVAVERVKAARDQARKDVLNHIRKGAKIHDF
jgi:hypothetical protein